MQSTGMGIRTKRLLWALIASTGVLSACSKKDNKPEPGTGGGKPEITAFSPARGVPGTIVTITGKNFGATAAANKVRFAASNLDAEITNASPTELKVKVPADAVTGKISITASNETVTTATDFTIDIAPAAITNFTPKQGPFGTVVTLTGTNLPNDATVTINGIEATITTKNNTQIVFSIPVNTTLNAHKIRIVSASGNIESTDNFTVTAAGAYANWEFKNVKLILQADAGAFLWGTSFVVNNKIYWGFSKMFTNSTKTEYAVYDPLGPTSDTWASLEDAPANMVPLSTQNMRTVVHNGRVFMGTGLSTGGATDQWWEFHPAANTATAMTNYPAAVSGVIPFVLNDNIYVGFGGVNNQLHKLDPGTAGSQGSWTNTGITAPFRELNTGSAFVIGDAAYMGMALPAVGQERRAFYKYTETGGLTKMTDFPQKFQSLYTSSFTVGNKGYFVTEKDVWEYTPDAAGGSWRAVIADAAAPKIIHTAVLTVNGARVVYGWTSSGWIYEFKLS